MCAQAAPAILYLNALVTDLPTASDSNALPKAVPLPEQIQQSATTGVDGSPDGALSSERGTASAPQVT